MIKSEKLPIPRQNIKEIWERRERDRETEREEMELWLKKRDEISIKWSKK